MYCLTWHYDQDDKNPPFHVYNQPATPCHRIQLKMQSSFIKAPRILCVKTICTYQLKQADVLLHKIPGEDFVQ